jgi:hypothetical protein
MAASDFLSSPEARQRHEDNTAATYLYFFRSERQYFDAMWRELEEERRSIVIERMRRAGASSAELAQLQES